MLLKRKLTIALVLIICLFSLAYALQNNGKNLITNNLIKDQATPLFLSSEEISIEAHRKAYNHLKLPEDEVILYADKIARVTLNEVILEQNILSEGDLISVDVFDDNIYNIQIDEVKLNDILSIRGHIEDNVQNVLYFNSEGEKVLATLELLDDNVIYSLKTTPCSNNYYLYKTSLDKLDDLEGDRELIAQEENGNIINDATESESSPDDFQVSENGVVTMPTDNDTDNKEKEKEITENEEMAYLFQKLELISKEKYINTYGEKSLKEHPITAVACRIGRAVINQSILEPGVIMAGDRLLINLFGDNVYNIEIDRVIDGEVTSIDGRVKGTEAGYMFLSVSESKVLATIELGGENKIFLLRYNPASSVHYLFEAPMDKVEHLPD